MSVGQCSTNTKENSIHKQTINLKQYLISIYYNKKVEKDDKAFKRASNYCMTLLKKEYCGEDFIFKEYEITTALDFKRVWKTIYTELNKVGGKIKKMHIFSHSSKTDEGNTIDGLEFVPIQQSGKIIEDGTISFAEIAKLEKLRWSPKSDLILHGCNTGLRGIHSQSIADAFAISQEKCKVHGQKGWAYFSKREHVYIETKPYDTNIYLWAYRRARNGFMEKGERIKPLIVERKSK